MNSHTRLHRLIRRAPALAMGSLLGLALLAPAASVAQRHDDGADRGHRRPGTHGRAPDGRGSRAVRPQNPRWDDHRRGYDDRARRGPSGPHDRYRRGHPPGRYAPPRRHDRYDRHYRHYRPATRHYYHGRRFYTPHGHFHAVYNLPVWFGGSLSYSPHSYCGGVLFQAPGFGFHLGF